ncbi:hypothetical protein [Streptomyces sp. NPDC050504]|uniref:hypothetical protein n=1 Tax=Streptomyces sp. NPDC050504 TaxID=3365618 RepID=UPI0037B4E878
MSQTEKTSRPQVQALLDRCTPQDAYTVMAVLRDRFGGDRAIGGDPGVPRSRSQVWTVVLVAEEQVVGHREEREESATGRNGSGGTAHMTHLHGTVDAALQGPPVAVRRVLTELRGAFGVRAVGQVAGDQEIEVQVRLESGTL